ncbi:MAG: NAD(P)H-dependent oxidoreductase [Campylobacteraceae bacterium]|nr:NAD(P)H-dependent oxidoreductase [Campylobacteraceae bacterium]
MKKTIAIMGSSRRSGNTGKLIDLIADELNIEVIDLNSKEISFFDYEHSNINDDFIPLMKYLLSYDNIIFVSPVYWFAMSAQMKVFIDRMSDFLSLDELKDMGRELRNKSAFVVTTSISDEVDKSFINSFIDTFDYLGLKYEGFIHLNCKNGFEQETYQDEINDFILKIKHL